MDPVTAELVRRLMASLLDAEQERELLRSQINDMREQAKKKGAKT